MIGRIGLDMREFRKRHLVVPVDERGAELCNGAALLQRRGPESSNVLAVCPLLLVEETEGAGKRLAEGNAYCGKLFREPVRQVVEDFSAPGESTSIRRMVARVSKMRVSFSEISFN